MDEVNVIRGLPTPFLDEANEWIEGWKATLSPKELKSFDSQWKKLDRQLEAFQNGNKGAISPYV